MKPERHQHPTFGQRSGGFSIPVVRAEDKSRPPAGWKPRGDVFVLLSDRYGVQGASEPCQCGSTRVVVEPTGRFCRRCGVER